MIPRFSVNIVICVYSWIKLNISVMRKSNDLLECLSTRLYDWLLHDSDVFS